MVAEEWRGPNGAGHQGGGLDLLSLGFPLDESTLQEAEQAASRFVNGPWNDSIPDHLGTGFNGSSPMGPGMGVPAMDPSSMPGMQVVPEFSWVAFPGHAASGGGSAMGAQGTAMGGAMMPAGTFVPAGMVAGAPMAPASPQQPQQQQQQPKQAQPQKPQAEQSPAPQRAPQAPCPTPTAAPTAAPGAAPPATPSSRERWSNMTEDAAAAEQAAPAPPAPEAPAAQAASEGAETGSRETPPHPAPAGKPQAPELSSNTEAAVAQPAEQPAQAPVQAPAAPAPRQAPNVSPAAPASAPPSEAPKTAAPAPAESPQQAQAGAPQSPTGRSFMNRTWAGIVSKDKEAELAAGRHASSSSTKEVSKSADDRTVRKDTIIDYLLFMARHRADGKAVNGVAPADLPAELKKFHSLLESGMNNISKSRYNRRGMKNDANNCYVNVVIQSLLPCSALMQLLSHCAQNNSDRPFYTGMARLCKEFHRKVEGQEALNVLAMTQVTEIISTWQSLGAQQDAGEFLFYMLNGMHDECKWKATEPPTSAGGSGEAALEGEDGERAAGVHEDSPIVRIFGGLIRSTVRSQSAKADSISVEPFNHLILDISSKSVDSVSSALENFCVAESVDEGRVTKRLQFKLLPKVLVLSLKRFSYNKDTGCPQKIKKAVKYEEKLSFDSSWLVDDVEPQVCQQEYQLAAVICHIGESVNGGHYNAAVRYNSDWFMYDDAHVRQITLAEVVSQQWTAYLLVYQCHDKVDIRP